MSTHVLDLLGFAVLSRYVPGTGQVLTGCVWGGFHDDSSDDGLGEYKVLLDTDMPKTSRAIMGQSPHQ